MFLCKSALEDIISKDSVKNSVLNEEERMQSIASTSCSKVFVADSRERSLYKEPKKDKNMNGRKYNKFANMKCYLFRTRGHMKKDCWKLKNKQQGH